MTNNGVEQIVIRHFSGSKANQIEHISLAGVNEITIGRDPKSDIAFDSSRDDVVSRRHAVIRVVRGDRISFRLADLGSNNGTFLNGERITGEVELLPEDSIGLGKTGVKFVFDVQPRPAYMVARTRVIDISDAAATRVIETAGIAARDAVSASEMSVEPAIQKFEPPPKVGVGKETVLHLLGEERRATSRVWISSLAAVAAFVALGGGAFYWKHKHDLVEMTAKVDQSRADLNRRTEEEQSERGLSPADIVQKFGNATAQIERAWRLYDQKTGKPVFHQTITVRIGDKKSGQSFTYPAYVQLPNGGVVRWLTLEDDNRTNIEIGRKASGTGFVVDEHGFMLTNKHVAAAWNLSFGEQDRANKFGYGWLYAFGGGPGATENKLKSPIRRIDLSDDDFKDLKAWVPASGGFVFLKDVATFPKGVEGNIPDPSKGGTHTFFVRNDVLEVRFANSRVSANANLVRFSNESDAALIKVDTPEQLNKVELATDDNVKVGEPVMALGYPSVAADTYVTSSTIENGRIRQNTDFVPVPFVTEGNVALLSPHVKSENGVTLVGLMGDIIQMTINSTGAGNSGGPVFNKKGEVIGLFTYGFQAGGANTSGAIPIRYGHDLMQSQHP